MSKPLVLIARIVPRAGHEEEVCGLLKSMVPLTRAEAGCRRYDLYRLGDRGRPQFLFHEVWEDQSALDRHMETSHVRALISRSSDVLQGDIVVERLTEVDRA